MDLTDNGNRFPFGNGDVPMTDFSVIDKIRFAAEDRQAEEGHSVPQIALACERQALPWAFARVANKCYELSRLRDSC